MSSPAPVKLGALSVDRLNEAVELVVQCFGEEQRALVTSDLKATFETASLRPQTFCAESNGQIVGLVQSHEGLMHWDMRYFSWLAVHPDERRQGIARQLLDHAEKDAVRTQFQGRAGTFLIVSSTDPEFYEKLGYERGSIKTVDGCPIMMKHYRPGSEQ